MSPVRIATILLGLGLVATACGGPSRPEGESGFAFGEPADAAEADRVIKVVTRDDFSFDPSRFTVAVGEVVTFEVTNGGRLPHDFTIGDESTQEEHSSEPHDTSTPDQPDLVVVLPGETKRLTWRFTRPGTVLVGCHQPGHYLGGMKGEVTVG